MGVRVEGSVRLGGRSSGLRGGPGPGPGGLPRSRRDHARRRFGPSGAARGGHGPQSLPPARRGRLIREDNQLTVKLRSAWLRRSRRRPRRDRDAILGAMRLATIRTEYGTAAARLDGDVLVPLDAADVGEVLAAGGEGRPQAGAAPCRRGGGFRSGRAAAGKVICVGLNYRAHIAETGREMPAYPTLFAKFAGCLIGARDDLVLPSLREGRLGGRARRRHRPPDLPGHAGRGGGGHRRLHGGQRRVDPGLAVAGPPSGCRARRSSTPPRPAPTSSRRRGRGTRPTSRSAARWMAR